MPYDETSFWQGVVVGRAMKGFGNIARAEGIDLGSSLRLKAEAEIISVASFSTAGDIDLGSSLRLEAEAEIIFVTTFEEVA